MKLSLILGLSFFLPFDAYVYGDTTINDGEFIQSVTSGKWSHPQVIMTGVEEGHTAITRVTGGTFTNNKSSESIFYGYDKATSSNFEVSGGKFNKAISYGFCANGFYPQKNADGTYGVAEGNVVAQVGSTSTATYYETLEAAIAAATATREVKLLQDVTLTAPITISKTRKLNLNNKSITVTESGKSAFIVDAGGNLTISDNKSSPAVNGSVVAEYLGGKITSTGETISVANGGQLTLSGGMVEATGRNAAIYVIGNRNPESSADTSAVASTVTMKGGYVKSQEYGIGIAGRGAVLIVTKGVIEAMDNAAIGGNGTNSSKRYDGGTTITISGTSTYLVSHIQSAGYIACGIYHPQVGTLNISGGTIYADKGVGILMRGGTLNMTGGTVTTTGSAKGKVGDSNVIANCYGVYVDGSANYYGATKENFTANISGKATVKTESTEVPALNLSSNTASTSTGTIAVSGGTFSTAVPEDYCEIGYQPTVNSDGMYTVDLCDAYYTDDKGNVQYGDLESLLNEAGDSVVTLFKDTTVKSGFSLTTAQKIDLGGKKLTLTDNLVSFGKIEDSQEGEGLIVVPEGKQLVLSGDTGDQISVYDAANSGYRFFTVDEMFGARVVDNEGYVKIYCAPVFKNNTSSGAWDLIKGHVDANSIRIRLDITLADGTSLEPTDVTFKDTYVKQLCGNPDGALWIKIKSLDEITAEQVASVTATPIMVSDTGASQKGTGYNALTA